MNQIVKNESLTLTW